MVYQQIRLNIGSQLRTCQMPFRLLAPLCLCLSLGAGVPAYADAVTGIPVTKPLQIFAPRERPDGRTWQAGKGTTVPETTEPPAAITLGTAGSYQTRGKMRLVTGISCDNGLSVPLDKWNYVVLSLPLDFDRSNPPQITLSAKPPSNAEHAARAKPVRDAAAQKLRQAIDSVINTANPQARLLWGDDAAEAAAGLAGTLGTVAYIPEQREVWYFPPLEFNDGAELYKPGRGKEPPSVRSVTINIRGRRDRRDTREIFTGQATIKLKRPPVVLVHGINNKPKAWEGMGGIGVGQDLRRAGFKTYAVDYSKNDLGQARQPKTGAKFFRANAPVEFAASQMAGVVNRALCDRRAEGFVGSRVDVLGHSYGGIVARWFTTMHAEDQTLARPRTFSWYVNSSNNTLPPDIYSIDKEIYASKAPEQPYHHVRKLVTIASPWRGTPIANIVNEVHGPAPVPAPKNFASLGQAPMKVGRFSIPMSRFIGDVLDLGRVPDRVPSLEVAAVESRWLRELNKRPFRNDIAYNAIAGNDNHYILRRIDLFTTISRSLEANTLPVLQRERIKGRRVNLSDGLIPVWSAVISQDSQLFRAAHNSIMWNREAKRYLLHTLDDATLKGGQELSDKWAEGWTFCMKLPKQRKGKLPEESRQWRFSPGRMAPVEIGDAYQLLTSGGAAGGDGDDDAVARIGAFYLENDLVSN